MRGKILPDGTLADYMVTLKPGDEGYDEEWDTALYQHREFGVPMPYADTD